MVPMTRRPHHEYRWGVAARKRAKSTTTVSERVLTAYHEAGHAVLSAAINDRPHHVSIKATGRTLGRSGARMSARPTSLAQVHLAGFAAEQVLVGRRPRQLDEEVRFAILARKDRALLHAFEGAEDRDGHRAVQGVLATGVSWTDDEIEHEVDRLYGVARESLGTVWPAVKAVAKALLEHEELDREAFDEAVGDRDIITPVIRIQQVHGLASVFPEAPQPATPKRARGTTKPSSPSVKLGPPAHALMKALRSDPKLAPIIEAFEAVRVESGRRLGSNGLKVNGTLFALFTQGTLVVKLPKERVAALVAAQIGKPFDPGHGRLTKEWLTVTSPEASWVDLAREAHDFTRSGR
jgi:hypothetical protein